MNNKDRNQLYRNPKTNKKTSKTSSDYFIELIELRVS